MPTIEELQAALAEKDKRISELDSMRGKQADELGSLRKQAEEAAALRKANEELKAQPPKPILPAKATLAEVVGLAGFKAEEIAKAFYEGKGLSEEQAQTFYAKTGLPGTLIAEQFEREAKQQQAMAQVAKEAAVRLAGGQQQFDTMMGMWAKQDAAARADVDKMLGNATTFLAGFDKIREWHRQVSGAGGSGSLLRPTGTLAGGATPFSSAREVLAAMRESQTKFGGWANDKAFMERLHATPQKIRDQIATA